MGGTNDGRRSSLSFKHGQAAFPTKPVSQRAISAEARQRMPRTVVHTHSRMNPSLLSWRLLFEPLLLDLYVWFELSGTALEKQMLGVSEDAPKL